MTRPKASLNVDNVQRQLKVARILATGRTPLDVMIENMLWIDQLAIKARAKYDKSKDDDDRIAALAIIREANAVAEKSAGYIHARYAAVTVSGDKENPLQVEQVLRLKTEDALSAYLKNCKSTGADA